MKNMKAFSLRRFCPDLGSSGGILLVRLLVAR